MATQDFPQTFPILFLVKRDSKILPGLRVRIIKVLIINKVKIKIREAIGTIAIITKTFKIYSQKCSISIIMMIMITRLAMPCMTKHFIENQ